MRSDARFWLSSWPAFMILFAAMVGLTTRLADDCAGGKYSWLPGAVILGLLTVMFCEFALRFLRSMRECTHKLQELQFAGGRLRVDGYSKRLEADIVEMMATRPQALREFHATVFPTALNFFWPLLAFYFLYTSVRDEARPVWLAGLLVGIGVGLLVWMLSARVHVRIKDGRLRLTPGHLPWMAHLDIDLANCTVHAHEQVGWIDIRSDDAMVRLFADNTWRARTFFYSTLAAIAIAMEQAAATGDAVESTA